MKPNRRKLEYKAAENACLEKISRLRKAANVVSPNEMKRKLVDYSIVYKDYSNHTKKNYVKIYLDLLQIYR